jgi:hypothetical protein
LYSKPAFCTVSYHSPKILEVWVVALQVGKRLFPTKTAAQKYFSRILASGIHKLEGEELEMVLSLLEYHPRAEDKVGAGVASVAVMPNAKDGGAYNGFVLRRVDGSVEGFSYRKCLTPKGYLSQRARQALRDDVQYQVWEFKSLAFENQVSCPLTGRHLRPDEAHIDHHPTSFNRLMLDFLRAEKLTLERVEVADLSPTSAKKTLADSSLRQRWRDYHRAHASLRAVYWRSNLSKGARDVPMTNYSSQLTAICPGCDHR